MFFGSDAIALAPFTDRITYLEDGDWAVLTRGRGDDLRRERQPRRPAHGQDARDGLSVDRGNHRHFMAKEIYEQPEVVGHTLAHYLDFAHRTRESARGFHRRFRQPRPAVDHGLRHGLLCRAGCKYWFERFARLPVDIDIASEFRYREQPLTPKGLAIVISQSGETADTLASLRYAKASRPADRGGGQRAHLDHRARSRLRAADPRRAGDRRRLDQGVHLPAGGFGLAGGRCRPGARPSAEEDEGNLVRALSEVPR